MLPNDVVLFTLDYYEGIIERAKAAGYVFNTLETFWHDGCPDVGRFVLRHDLDANPLTLKGMLDREERQRVPATVFVRVTGNTYNPFDYRVFPLIKRALDLGHEVGLHTNFVEFALLNEQAPRAMLRAEMTALHAFFNRATRSVACHRDYNYVHNSLPWLEKRWAALKSQLSLSYQAYDPLITENSTFVNETVNPRLGWRTVMPEQAIAIGRSIVMSTHPHWWFEKHPFET